jgi:hypothetical protein
MVFYGFAATAVKLGEAPGGRRTAAGHMLAGRVTWALFRIAARYPSRTAIRK